MRLIPNLACFLTLFASTVAMAGVLTVTPGAKEIEKVKVSTSAQAKVADRTYNLKLVGAGLRYKKVALFKADVYVGELLVDAPEKFTKTSAGALDSLTHQKAAAIRMTFLRDVEGEKVGGSFKEGLEENKAPVDSANVKAFIDAVKSGGESKKGTTLVLIGERLVNGKEAVSWENSAGKLTTITGDAGFMKTIFSIWFGKIDDSGLESLRDQILGLKD
jgi:hypothetical protein